MWLQGRKFRTLSEKPKNAIKIKIGCVVIKLQVLKLNPDHLWSRNLVIIIEFLQFHKSMFYLFLSSQMHPKAKYTSCKWVFSRVHGITMSNLGNICARAFFFKDDHGAKMWKIFKVGIHIDGGVNDTCLQGRIFKTFSEKLKNAIKIKIGCVVTE